jgi:hypothetical protein
MDFENKSEEYNSSYSALEEKLGPFTEGFLEKYLIACPHLENDEVTLLLSHVVLHFSDGNEQFKPARYAIKYDLALKHIEDFS